MAEKAVDAESEGKNQSSAALPTASVPTASVPTASVPTARYIYRRFTFRPQLPPKRSPTLMGTNWVFGPSVKTL